MLLSDPAGWEGHGYARQAREFVDVEFLGAGSELTFLRYGGSSADRLRLLDTGAPILTLTATIAPLSLLTVVDWPVPPPAYGSIVAVLARTGVSPATCTFRVRTRFLA